MALYESHAHLRLKVVAVEWKRHLHTPNVGTMPRAQPVDALQQTHTNQVHAGITAQDACLSQIRGPSIPKPPRRALRASHEGAAH